MTRRVLGSLLVAAIALVVVARADNPINIKVDPKKTNQKDDAKLDAKNAVEEAAFKQQRMSQQFREFEGALLRLAQRLETSSKAEDREKAVILKKAIEKAMNEGVDTKFDRLVTLLRDSKAINPDFLEKAMEQNKALADDIRTILAILLTDNRDEELRRQQEYYRNLLKQLNAIIRDQKTVHALTNRDSISKERLGGEQNKVTKATEGLARALGKGNGKDGDQKGAPKGEGKPGAPKGEGKEDTKERKADDKKPDAGSRIKESDRDKKAGEKAGGGPKEGQGGAKGAPKDGDKENKGGSKAGDPKQGEQPKPGDKGGQKSESKSRGDGKGESKPGSQGGQSGQQQQNQQKQQNQQGQSKGGQQSGRQGQQGQAKGDQQNKQQQGNQQQQDQQQQDQLPARKKIEDASQDQHSAEKNIDKDKRPDAAKDEAEAIDKLTQAKKALEELLRQLREEEIERLLAQLQQRCERMLAMQIEVKDGTVSTQRAIDGNADKKPSRTEVQKGLQLADREDQIVIEASKAIDLLKTEGSAVAFPEVFIQIRSDMMNVSRRLRKTDASPFTQTVEQDIIDTLKEMIEALKKAQKDQQAKRQNPQQQQQSQPGDDKLIDLIAELKMIRSLQVRVNARTKAYAQQYEGQEQAPVPEADMPPEEKERYKLVLDELKDLAARQQKIYEVTEDIAKGRNK